MTSPVSLSDELAHMPSLAEIFRRFLAGRHLNRMAEPALWHELETRESGYRQLFAALGFDLRIDARGFAWFNSPESSATISKTSRQLALLFMVIFDAQANAGQSLQRFTDWLIETSWLTEIHKQHQEMLDAEGLNPDALAELLNRASSLGLALARPQGWHLLPAVFRYLDHFEALAANDDTAENATGFDDMTDTDDADSLAPRPDEDMEDEHDPAPPLPHDPDDTRGMP